jgi:hypothetical protein
LKLTRIAAVLLLSVLLGSVSACSSTSTSKVYMGRVVWGTNSSPAAGTDVSVSGIHVHTDSEGNYSVTVDGGESSSVLIALNDNCYATMQANKSGYLPELRLVCPPPTPIRTPVPMATGPWKPCDDLVGSWNTDWGVMDFVQIGFVVTATLENNHGLLVGSVLEGRFTGVWYIDASSTSAQTYNVSFDIRDDCNYFTGNLSGQRVNPRPVP